MEPNYSIKWSARLVGATTVAKGDILIPNDAGTAYVVATAANRGTRRAEGVALSAYSGASVGSTDLQQAGTIDPGYTGLAAGSASWVRVSAAGRAERCTPSGSDDVIGYCEADGRLHLTFGVLTAAIVNGGGSVSLPLLLDTDNATDIIKIGPNPSGGTFPAIGTIQSQQQSAPGFRTLIGMKDGGGDDIPLLGHDWVRIGIGASWTQSDLSAGTTTRIAKVGIFADTNEVYADRWTLTDDRGGYERYVDMNIKEVTTANTTPVALGLTAAECLGGNGGGGPTATFVRAWNSPNSADWVYNSLGIKVYEKKTAGASGWDYNGTNVTGDLSVEFNAVSLGPHIPYRLCQIGTQISFLHESGNRTIIPDYDGELPTSGSGAGVYTLEAEGAVGDGSTNDTAAWDAVEAAMGSTPGVLVLGANKTYLVTSTFTLPAGCSIVGYGSTSVIKTTSDIAVIVMGGERTLCRDFRVVGDNGTSAQIAIQVGNAGTCYASSRVSGIEIEDMYHGVKCTGGSSLTYDGPIISDCRVIDANIGYSVDTQAEYVTFTNCHASQALVAVRSPGSGFDIAAGNCTMIGCVSDRNVYGMRLQAGTNDAHGQAIGCHFNHNGSPVNAGAIINGHTFIGCHIYGGELWLNGCTGVRFVDCMGYLDAGSGFLANSAVDTQIINWRFTASTAFAIDSTSSITFERCHGNATALTNLGVYVRRAYTMADSNQTLSAQESCASTLVVSGALTAARNLTISRAPCRHTVGSGAMLVHNTTTQTINVGWSTGTKVAVAASAKAWVGDDGTNAQQEAA